MQQGGSCCSTEGKSNATNLRPVPQHRAQCTTCCTQMCVHAAQYMSAGCPSRASTLRLRTQALHSNGSGPNGPRLTYRPGAVFCGWSPPVCWSLCTGQAAAGRRPWPEASVGEKSGGARILDTRTMMTTSQSAGALAGEGDYRLEGMQSKGRDQTHSAGPQSVSAHVQQVRRTAMPVARPVPCRTCADEAHLNVGEHAVRQVVLEKGATAPPVCCEPAQPKKESIS